MEALVQVMPWVALVLGRGQVHSVAVGKAPSTRILQPPQCLFLQLVCPKVTQVESLL